jgi:hypothetical protein
MRDYGKTEQKDSRLIVIATEGDVTEPEYFNQIIDLYHNSRIKLHIIKPIEHRSAPNHVLNNLNRYCKEIGLTKNDYLFIVIDKDRWTMKMLNKVASECEKKNYLLAISNPNFELWLLLHFISLQGFLVDKCDHTGYCKTKCRKYLSELGVYNKKKKIKEIERYFENLCKAIENAKKIDECSEKAIPQMITSRVYKIIDKIHSIII